MNNEYFAKVMAAKLEDDPMMAGFEWDHVDGMYFLKEDAPNKHRGPKWWLQKRYESGRYAWWVIDFASFPVSGPFPDRKAAMFALLLMRGE